jgi:exodeoxyribonuclease-1
VCRLVKSRCPALWSRFIELASKDAVSRFLDDHAAFLLIEPIRSSGTVVTAIGDDPAQNNLTYCWDLAVDPRPFVAMSDNELSKALGKPHSPVRKVKKNAAPTLCPLDEAPDHLMSEIDAETYVRRAAYVRRDREFVARLLRIMGVAATEYPPSPHVERQLYEGFWSNADGQRLRDFHSASWTDRVVIADALEDQRLAWLARRIIWVERPDLSPEYHANSLLTEKAARMMAADDDCGGWNTLSKAAAELEKMLPSLEPEAAVPFLKLQTYIAERRAECEQVLRR